MLCRLHLFGVCFVCLTCLSISLFVFACVASYLLFARLGCVLVLFCLSVFLFMCIGCVIWRHVLVYFVCLCCRFVMRMLFICVVVACLLFAMCV